jgi:hypothetical protein
LSPNWPSLRSIFVALYTRISHGAKYAAHHVVYFIASRALAPLRLAVSRPQYSYAIRISSPSDGERLDMASQTWQLTHVLCRPSNCLVTQCSLSMHLLTQRRPARGTIDADTQCEF